MIYQEDKKSTLANALTYSSIPITFSRETNNFSRELQNMH
ncbi:hypothetical protein DOT_4902 [Desulfosporosinus sp. OT]|nr:hypothetical protein DOT_4902 [Desulfosporosinus sp. OT]